MVLFVVDLGACLMTGDTGEEELIRSVQSPLLFPFPCDDKIFMLYYLRTIFGK